jgi:hypothetical protein
LAKFIRYETLWKLLFKQFFYQKVHGDVLKGCRKASLGRCWRKGGKESVGEMM